MSHKITPWFSHDSNARNDEKILKLRIQHGAAGYGTFFMLIERLRDSSGYKSIKDYNAIAFDLRVDAKLIKSVVEDFGLFTFTEDGECFYSESLMRRMAIKDSTSKARSEAGRKGAAVRWGSQNSADNMANASNNDSKGMANASNNMASKVSKVSKVKDSKVKESKEEKSKRKDSTNNAELIKPIIDYLNQSAGTRYRYTSNKTQTLIKARLKEGFTLDDFKTVISKKTEEWLGSEMEKYLRPETLFGSKFEGYLNQKVTRKLTDAERIARL